MDLIWLGYEFWKLALCVSSVYLTIIVKLVSIKLNSESHINDCKSFGQAAWKRPLIAICSIFVS